MGRIFGGHFIIGMTLICTVLSDFRAKSLDFLQIFHNVQSTASVTTTSINNVTSTSSKTVTQPPSPSLSAISPTITPNIEITTEPMTLSDYNVEEEVTDGYLHDSDEDEDEDTTDTSTNSTVKLESDSPLQNNTIDFEVKINEHNGDSYYAYNTSTTSGDETGFDYTISDENLHRLLTYAGHSALAVFGIVLIFVFVMYTYVTTQKMYMFAKLG